MASQFQEIKDTAVQIIFQPTAFFSSMEKDGGFGQPVLFVAVMGVATALVSIALSLLGLGLQGFGVSFGGIILFPIFMVIATFIMSGIVFLIWKLMGSRENFQTAFRCYAYLAAITPLTTALNAIPVVGSLLGLAWLLWLIVIASVQVHGISPKKAWIVFGILTFLFALVSLRLQSRADDLEQRLHDYGQQSETVAPAQETTAALGHLPLQRADT